MATMMIAGEKLQMPVWLKIAVLNVESGSEPGKRHNVRHNGHTAISCDCRATIEECAHVLAANRYLALASDTQAHLDDENNQEEDGELAAQAEEIIREEKKRKDYKRRCAFSGIERRFELAPSGAMVLMR